MKKKNNKGLIIALILLLLSAIGAAGFFGYQYWQVKQQVQAPQTTEEATEAQKTTTASDPTADWQTYTNEEYGFEVKYPSDWYGPKDDQEMMIYNYDVDKAPGRAYVPSVDGDLFKIQIGISEDYSDIESWFAAEKKKNSPVTDKPYEFLNTKTIAITSQNGIFYELKDEMTGALVGNANFESPGDYIVHFWGALNYEGNKEIFNQILSTFRFLEENNSQKKEVLSAAVKGYLNALIKGDQQTALFYLTSGVKPDVPTGWPTNMYSGYKIYEILNEFHSQEEEESFYNQEKITFTIKLYQENDPKGNKANLLFVKEDGKWKTLTWYLFQ